MYPKSHELQLPGLPETQGSSQISPQLHGERADTKIPILTATVASAIHLTPAFPLITSSVTGNNCIYTGEEPPAWGCLVAEEAAAVRTSTGGSADPKLCKPQTPSTTRTLLLHLCNLHILPPEHHPHPGAPNPKSWAAIRACLLLASETKTEQPLQTSHLSTETPDKPNRALPSHKSSLCLVRRQLLPPQMPLAPICGYFYLAKSQNFPVSPILCCLLWRAHPFCLISHIAFMPFP